MLELLHGPTLRLLPDLTTAPAYSLVAYDDAVGLIGVADSNNYVCTQLDGSVQFRANTRNYGVCLDQQTGGWITTGDTFDSPMYPIVPFDIVSGACYGATISSGSYGNTLNLQARLADRWLRGRVASGHVLIDYRPLDFSAAWVTEATLYAASGSDSWTTMSRTLSAKVMCVISQTGYVVWYDTEAKVAVGPMQYLPTNVAAWYSAALGVYVVLDASNKVSVHAASPRPYALSAPVAVSALTLGQENTVYARLTGNSGEPCPNEIVSWSLLAGNGTLGAAQSVTDTTGNAVVNYLAPLTGPDSPNIKAAVIF